MAVEGLIFDSNYNWILHRRGPKCRDEQYKLEGIGGRVQIGELFVFALLREIAEEVGKTVKVKIIQILEVRRDTVFDARLNKTISWLIISYICVHLEGSFEICEPEKNLGFERIKIGEANVEELSSSSKAAYVKLTENWDEIYARIKEEREK
ncbi:MAG: NUDIX domain-containing protein [Clostridia bacterium]|nr:NUDIX domain-containing protein [Clostridia bacterium]